MKRFDPKSEVDVCVIGSGAGGAPIALELSRAGFSVVVLEKGPFYGTEQFVHDELGIVRRNFFVPYAADEPHVLRSSVDEVGTASTFGWISCCVGGGTVHWAGYSFRLSPDDFRRQTLTGGIAGASLADWPITYDELEPWYEKAEREVGIAGTAGATPFDPPRKSEYPLPPVDVHPIATHIDRVLTERGIHPFPTPRAVLSRPYGGRKACVYCDFCASYGCEVSAKGSTSDALLPSAIASGRCEVRAHSMARMIRVNDSGRATSVVYSDKDGVEHEQRARIIVVACSAIETPRLLLNSHSSRFPNGLANSSGLVGRNLMFLASCHGSGDFLFEGKASIENLRRSDPFVGRAVRDLYASAGTLLFEFSPMSPILTAEKLSAAPGGSAWGTALKDRLRTWYREGKHLEFEGFSECLPVATNAVDVTSDFNDRYGLPVARITFSRHEDDLTRSARLASEGLKWLEALGPDRVGGVRSGTSFDVLQGGTCRFGDSPEASVLDRNCRTHDVPNLYVSDGSFMPTIGAVPNTLTILANSFRVANQMVADARRRDVQ